MKKTSVLLLMATLSFAVLQSTVTDAPELAKGDVAPDCDLIDEGGKSVKLSDYRDQKRGDPRFQPGAHR